MQFEIFIEGIVCPTCAQNVEHWCKALPFVQDVIFTPDWKTMILTSAKEIPLDWIRVAVQEAGYCLVESRSEH